MKPKKNFNFADKWSPEIEKLGFVSVPNQLITNQVELEITNGELVVLLGLLYFMWTNDNPYPSVPTLSKLNGMAHNTVRTHIRSLNTKGLIRRKFRKASSNEYDLSPLKSRLHHIALSTPPSVRKRNTPYSNSDTPAYPNSDTKKDAAKKTYLRKPTGKNSTSKLGDILAKRVRDGYG